MSKSFLEQIDSEKRFQLLVEAVTDYAIYLLDIDGRVVSWNSGAARITGYAASEIIGHHFSRFFTDEDRASGKPARALDTARRVGRFEEEGWRKRKDGSRFWTLAVLDAVRDNRGNVIGFAKVTRDMTSYREAQLKLEEAREQLFQAQKMEAIGQLTGGVAHDFNNLLTVIIGGADLAQNHIEGNEKLKRLIDNMRHAALRGESLTKQLLAFSRRQPLKPEFVDLSEQLKTVIDLLSRSLRGDIEMITDVPSDLWPVLIDPAQLELALLNIGLNARDAMPDGGKLKISARNLNHDRNDSPGAPFVAIDLEDTGIGMTPEVKARAFEPFFTTKGIGRGSGLGLSQAYGFATQSGGLLTLDSAVGKGTKVTLYLPAAPSARASASAEERPVRLGTGQATILLVEDDAAVGELALGLLEGAGYKVKTAANAEAALDILRGGAQFDLVFSDVMMPGGMNGAELARIIRKEFPSIFVLLSTGYAAATAGTITQEFPVILKPYGRETLLDQVGKILGEVT